MVHLQSLGLSNLFLKTAFASYKISGFENACDRAGDLERLKQKQQEFNQCYAGGVEGMCSGIVSTIAN